ncbi:MAG: cytochrome c biogenesis CcdA family protein [Acidimicrobiales bacterium]|nr:cytochrome c biogenesis CcdA family protein [Acidimicrobiales bacterium]
MRGAPLAYAFGLGMVAAFNPCGFAMLPAYLSYFLGLEGETDSHLGAHDSMNPDVGILRALAVGASVSAGFVSVFASMGLLIETTARGVEEYLPWLTIVLGIGLVVLGIAMLRGRSISVKLPFTNRRFGTGREITSVFLFGVSYAFVSLSCTISLFLATVSTAFTQASFAAGIATFIAFAVGMSLVLIVLTLAIALARTTVVRTLRRILPHVNKIAAVALIIAGLYVAYYGNYELRVYSGDTRGGGPAQLVFELNARVSSWIQHTGPVRIGLLLAGIVAASIIVALGLRASHRRTEPCSSRTELVQTEVGDDPDRWRPLRYEQPGTSPPSLTTDSLRRNGPSDLH